MIIEFKILSFNGHIRPKLSKVYRELIFQLPAELDLGCWVPINFWYRNAGCWVPINFCQNLILRECLRHDRNSSLQHVRNESHVIKTGLQILQIRGIQIMELRIKEVLHLHERKIQEKSKQYHNLVQNRISLNNQNQLSIFCIWNYNTWSAHLLPLRIFFKQPSSCFISPPRQFSL